MRSFLSQFILSVSAFIPDYVRVWIARSKLAPFLRSVMSPASGVDQLVEIKAGPAHGMRIFTDLSINRAYAVGTYEPENVQIIKRSCAVGMTVIDVGAHEGYLTLVMAACVGNTGQVYAFEPMPRNFECLRQTIAVNNLANVHVYQAAVSDGRNPRGKFIVSEQSSSMGKLVEDGDSPAETELEVDVVSLDQMAKAAQFVKVDFVKVDVEGHDLEVLEGMRGLTEHCQPKILIEFHSPTLLAQGCEMLVEQGYDISIDSSRKWTVFAH